MTPTPGDQGGTRRAGTGGQALRLRVEDEAPPKSRARARKGSVTTVAIAPPIWRSTSAIARNTKFPFLRSPAAPAGRYRVPRRRLTMRHDRTRVPGTVRTRVPGTARTRVLAPSGRE
ncbi:hypothetical protein CHR28_21315 [Streptomyces sp. XY006]|nr:hypothetical protein CHR28_21315 [Streptomyces sp. XY006]